MKFIYIFILALASFNGFSNDSTLCNSQGYLESQAEYGGRLYDQRLCKYGNIDHSKQPETTIHVSCAETPKDENQSWFEKHETLLVGILAVVVSVVISIFTITTQKTQQFESTFFNYLNLLNNVIENIKYSDAHSGRDSFKYIYGDLKKEYDHIKAAYVLKNFGTSYSLKAEDIPLSVHEVMAKQAYLALFNKHQAQLGHYFRTAYNIVKFVNENKWWNGKYYTNILRAQLSTYEHALLFYNCFSQFGEKQFKPLVIKYSLLDNLNDNELLDSEHYGFYPDKAYSKDSD